MPHATEHPSAVILHGKVYIGGGWAGDSDIKNTMVAVYEPTSDQWSKLLPFNTECFGMAVIHDKLVLVGGRDPHTRKESRNVGVWDSKAWKWTAPYCELTIACYLPTVIGYRKWLIVAGSASSIGKAHDTVKVLDTTSNQWHTAPSRLPLGCIKMTHAIVRDTVYLLGG